MDQGDAGEKLCGGKGQEDSGAEQIAGDDQGTFASAVGQDPGMKGQQQGWEFGGEGDQRDVEGGGVQFDDGQDGQRDRGHAAPGNADALGDGIVPEVSVSP